jgi:peptidyl-prolyl cis-trans isomerase SurA
LKKLNQLILAVVGMVGLPHMLQAQPLGVVEEVIAVVGENILLKSDIDKEYFQLSAQYPDYEGDLKCELFDQLITQKLLLYKADLDSIVIADERLEYEINRRLEFYASQAGSIERLEEYLGIPILQYKQEMSEKVKHQMLVQEAQASLLNDVKISPTEVRKFYNEIPEDSMPQFNAEVEVGQILIKPKASPIADKYAKDLAENLRAEIVAGTRDFCITASLYSDDGGNKADCGSLGEFKRGSMVGEFERAAFKLKKDSISPVTKTEFGYHIIQLVERKGDILNARHILIRPKIVSGDYQKTIDDLKGLAKKLRQDSIEFCDAVQQYSDDEVSKVNCGFFTDPNAGTNKIEITDLEPDVALRIDKLQAGEYSEPHSVAQMDGSTAYRILYLKSEIPPHRADLTRDYQKIANFALEKKKQETLQNWSEGFKTKTYIWIDEKYVLCPESEKWIQN